MPNPTEHKTVQARILAYAQEIDWTILSRAEAERRRGVTEPGLSSPGLGEGEDTGWKTRAPLSLYFGELLHGQLRAFNPLYQEAAGAGIGQWQRLPSSIAGKRDFLMILRNQSRFWNRLLKNSKPPD